MALNSSLCKKKKNKKTTAKKQINKQTKETNEQAKKIRK